MSANIRRFPRSAWPEAGIRERFDLTPRRQSYVFAGAATLALASLAPCLANAQQAAGPVQVGGASQPLTIGVQERTTYDTNVARGADQAAAIRGLDRGSDVIYAPSVTVNYASGIARQGLALRGYFGYDYYQKNKQLRREQIDFSAAGNTAIGSRCFGGGRVAYDRGQSGLEDLTLLVTKNTIQTYTVSASESCASGTGLTESLQVSHSATTNTAPLLVNFDTTGVAASVGYANRTIGNVSLVASHSKTSYDNPAVALPGTPDGLSVSSIGAQISRPIGSRLAGTAGVYYSTSDSDLGPGALPGQDASFSGVTANAGLTYHVGPRLNLAANISRSVEPSIRQGVGFAINNQVGLSANYTVSSRISAYLGGSWSRQSFRGDDLVLPGVAPDRVELKNASAGVSVKLGRNSALSADVNHEESSTDLALFNFKSDRVSLTISTSF
jgi:hypothetical protein